MKQILIRPVITEKATELAEQNQYVFYVNTNANKIEVEKAVEKRFNVKVDSVRTVMQKGKKKGQMTRRGRYEGFTANVKKAYVTLAEGNKIDFYGTGEAQ